MRKRKACPKTTTSKKNETLIPREVDDDDDDEEKDKENQGKGFYACYLLTSLCPRFKGHTYIGFTVNPRRRIRQHNGEIRCGAWRTKKRRPWEMVLCLFGFPTNVSALQFEWAWQHPTESLAVRQAAAEFKTFSGVANKIKLAYTMLNLPAWQSLNITVNYFSTKYTNHSAGFPSLPEHMKVKVCPMDELPCYTKTDEILVDGGNAKDFWDNEKAWNESGTLNVNMAEFQDSPIDESLCYNRREYCLSEAEGGKDDKEYNEAINNCEIVKASSVVTHFRRGIFGLKEEYCGGQQRDLPILQEDCEKSCSYVVTRASSSFSMKETTDGDDLAMINRSVSESDWTKGKNFTSEAVAKKDQRKVHSCTIPHNIEVIDLLSPSPECRVKPSTKKRRASPVYGAIIDLT